MAHKSLYTKAHVALRERLVAGRVAAGLTQQQLAKRLRRPQSFVSKYEGGERRLDIIELIDISSEIDLDLIELLKLLRRYR